MEQHFKETASFIQRKTNSYRKHERALLSNKNESRSHMRQCNRELQSLAIPSPEELLSFASTLEPSTANLFPECVPTSMPMLESLCKCIAGPIRPLPTRPDLPNTLFFNVVYHPRDTSQLTIRHLCENHCEEVFKEQCNVDQFMVCYHRDRNLKECLSPSTYREPYPNVSIKEFFKRLA